MGMAIGLDIENRAHTATKQLAVSDAILSIRIDYVYLEDPLSSVFHCSVDSS